jgi:hypothetical protein
LFQSRDGLHKVADKIVRIETSLIYKVSTTVSLYYTEAQLQGLENATGHNRTEFSVYQVDAAAYTGASSQNTRKYTATYTAIPGVGGFYTITFTEKANGSYALGYPVSILGTTNRSGAINPEENSPSTWQFGSIYPNPGSGIATVTVTAPKEQKMTIDVINVSGQVLFTRTQQAMQGANKFSLPVEQLSRGAYMIRFRDAEGHTVNSQFYNRH